MTTLDFGGGGAGASLCRSRRWQGDLKNPDWVEFRRQVAEVSDDFGPAHASGSVDTSDLREVVAALNPEAVPVRRPLPPPRACPGAGSRSPWGRLDNIVPQLTLRLASALGQSTGEDGTHEFLVRTRIG